MDKSLPATVAILTRNSDATVREALESARDFAEIIVCDGGSTDNTLDIARAYGARVIPQDSRLLDETGRIQDYAGVRNQTLRAASYPWFFFLDSDELLTPALVEELRRVVTDTPAAYWVPRNYVYRGKVIHCAVTYPNVQMRFFNRSVVGEFVKQVHERIERTPQMPIRTLENPMLVPLPDTVEEQKSKWLRYLAIERSRRSSRSWPARMRAALREAMIALLYILRLVRITLFCRGNTLPARFEWARVWYQWMLMRDLVKPAPNHTS